MQFIAEAKAKESEEKESRLARIRPSFRSLLSDHPSIYSYSTFKTADALFTGNATWSQAKGEDERRALFEEYISELKQKETVERRELRNRNILKLTSLLKTLSITISTRWRDAHDLVLQSSEWKSDESLRRVDTLEVLILFEDYMKELEREHDLAMRKKKLERSREGRRARDAFRVSLSVAGTIHNRFADTLSLLTSTGSASDAHRSKEDHLQVPLQGRSLSVRQHGRVPRSARQGRLDPARLVPGRRRRP